MKIGPDAELQQYQTAKEFGFTKEYYELNVSQEKVREKFAASILAKTFQKDVKAAYKDATRAPYARNHDSIINAYKDWVGVNC